MKNKVLYIVVPCYNEEEVIVETTNQLDKKIKELIKKGLISEDSKILYVNDGSKDKTWDKIKKISNKNSFFTGISLSKNKGHQNALVAGLLTASKYADIIISIIKETKSFMELDHQEKKIHFLKKQQQSVFISL